MFYFHLENKYWYGSSQIHPPKKQYHPNILCITWENKSCITYHIQTWASLKSGREPTTAYMISYMLRLLVNPSNERYGNKRRKGKTRDNPGSPANDLLCRRQLSLNPIHLGLCRLHSQVNRVIRLLVVLLVQIVDVTYLSLSLPTLRPLCL